MELSAEEMKLIKDARESIKKKAREYKIRTVDEYTTQEKVEAFDAMHGAAASMFQKVAETGHSDDDDAYYAWENQMGFLANKEGGRKEFWENYRKLQR